MLAGAGVVARRRVKIGRERPEAEPLQSQLEIGHDTLVEVVGLEQHDLPAAVPDGPGLTIDAFEVVPRILEGFLAERVVAVLATAHRIEPAVVHQPERGGAHVGRFQPERAHQLHDAAQPYRPAPGREHVAEHGADDRLRRERNLPGQPCAQPFPADLPGLGRCRLRHHEFSLDGRIISVGAQAPGVSLALATAARAAAAGRATRRSARPRPRTRRARWHSVR